MLKRHLMPLAIVLATLAVPATSQAYSTGIGDEQVAMFGSPLFKALNVQTARYIVSYDVVRFPGELAVAAAWLNTARSQNIRPLVAFYHSRHTPTRMPSIRTYLRYVKKFVRLFPWVKDYQPWNEANRGNIRAGSTRLNSPTPKQAAQYYEALRANCKGCTVVGLDVLDSTNISATITYIHQFQRYVRHYPRVWGLHNYSDTNRFRNKGTRAVLAAVRGQVWLTETGGIVKFGGAFPNKRGAGLIRARKAIDYMFKLAGSNHRLTRLYIFQWTGGDSFSRFDAGLTNPNGSPRPGYGAVYKHLHH